MTAYEICAGYLCERVEDCTCAGGTPESSYLHEPQCGLEPIMPLGQLDELLTPPRVWLAGETIPADTIVVAQDRDAKNWCPYELETENTEWTANYDVIEFRMPVPFESTVQWARDQREKASEGK